MGKFLRFKQSVLSLYFCTVNQPAPLQNRMLTGMAAATLLGMPLLAWIIVQFTEDIDLMTRWTGPEHIGIQLVWGIPVGLVAALIAKFIVSRNFMTGVRLRYERMFRKLRLNWSEIIFISLCAGVGEELLFRGVVQPLLGILFTSILFVLIHGYLNPRDWRISIYGVYMTLVIVGLGIMTEEIGIWSAVAAHTVIDIVLLADLRKPHDLDEPNALNTTQVESESLPIPAEPHELEAPEDVRPAE